METNQAGMPRGWTMLPTADSLDSTNTWLKTHVEGYADRSVLIAREQTAGRGRNGRVFHSAKDRGLYTLHLVETRAKHGAAEQSDGAQRPGAAARRYGKLRSAHPDQMGQ